MCGVCGAWLASQALPVCMKLRMQRLLWFHPKKRNPKPPKIIVRVCSYLLGKETSQISEVFGSRQATAPGSRWASCTATRGNQGCCGHRASCDPPGHPGLQPVHQRCVGIFPAQPTGTRVFNIFVKGVLHSSFGWHEISVPAKLEGTAETILQWFIRTKKQFQAKVASHVGSDGLFFRASCIRFHPSSICLAGASQWGRSGLWISQKSLGKSPWWERYSHYQLARLKVGKQWPQEIVGAEVASISASLFRGGGKRCDSVASWRPAHTPSSRVRKAGWFRSTQCTHMASSSHAGQQAAFWSRIWQREKPSAQEAYQYWQQNVSRSPNLPRNDFTAQGLRGCLLRWHERAEVPQVWRSIEQVHIHKPDSTPGASDGASAAKDEANFDSKCCLRGCGQCMGPEPFHQSLD